MAFATMQESPDFVALPSLGHMDERVHRMRAATPCLGA
jgi:hypothetical protein